MKKTFYITTPIYYPSANPHIGHCYTTVACDSIARFKRFQGYDVMFSTGTDEHGMKIEQSAEKAGLLPKEYVDNITANFKKLWEYMNISYDRYIRTTDSYHMESVQVIFKKLYDKGYIYKSEYSGKYCVPDESFWTETQLVDGKCPDCGREVIEAKEEAYFLKMSPFSERIKKLLCETDYLRPESRVNEMVNNFIKPGLEDLCVSRSSFKWGIPVSFDEKHVIYVWIDALSNYITLLGYENDEYTDFDKYWPCDLHMTGNEIVRFHSIIWPAILMALELPLPKKLYSHGWINYNGVKMSKSLGNVVDPFILGERYGVDAVRYQILRDMPYGNDMSYSNENMITRINADLSNNLGNLVSRTVAMVKKYFGGVLPAERVSDSADNELIEMSLLLRDKVAALIDEPQLSQALAEIFKVISRANKYIDETAPWILAKEIENHPRLAAVLGNLLEAVRITSALLSCFMPTAIPKVWEQIGALPEHLSYEKTAEWNVLVSVPVKHGEIIFPRFDAEKEIKELNELLPSEQIKVKDEDLDNAGIITIDEFSKVKLRTAEIVKCEKVIKSKKLLKLNLNDGRGGRQVVSGIAEYYEPADLIGKKIIFAANLAPAKLCGEESQGMVLAACGEGFVKVIFVDGDIPNGSAVR